MKQLGIVTCFFNPCGYVKRLHNYEIFKFNIEHPDVRVLTVELAFEDNNFEIMSGDTLQVRSNSVMWHKERLLNIGIQRLIDDGFEKLVWCDADMVFQDKNWYANIMRALDKNPLVQCFDSAEQCYSNMSYTQFGIAHSLHNPETMRVKDGYFRSVMGGCWGITAEMYKRIKNLYDYYIVGGGDAAFALGVVSHHLDKDPVNYMGHRQDWLSKETCHDYVKWLYKFRLAMSGYEIGYVGQSAKFLSHGQSIDRQYKDRYKLIENFDHTLDLLTNEFGVFEWGTPRGREHMLIRKYFEGRREDD